MTRFYDGRISGGSSFYCFTLQLYNGPVNSNLSHLFSWLLAFFRKTKSRFWFPSLQSHYTYHTAGSWLALAPSINVRALELPSSPAAELLPLKDVGVTLEGVGKTCCGNEWVASTSATMTKRHKCKFLVCT